MTSIKDLKSDHKNARKRTDRSASLIKESLERYGAARSIVIDEDNRILAGNGTIEGAKAAGIENLRVIETDGTEIIAVKRTGLSEEEKVGLALADNRTSDLSDWDADMLKQLSEEQNITPWFDDEDLAEIIGEVEQLPAEGLTDVDDVPEPLAEPTTKPGDLWVLGNHRLLCGDSTNPQHVERLMDGKKADACITDPPYGVLDESWDRPLSFDDVSMALSVTTGPVCMFNATRTDLMAKVFQFPQIPERIAVWRLSSSISPGQGMFRTWQPIYVWRAKNVKGWDAIDFVSDSPDKTGEHPTQKPVGLIEKWIDACSAKTIYEPFAGSGTTLIAAEKKRASVFAVELSPAYCDVIVKRWKDFTGKTAVCEPSEAHFEQGESF